MDSGLVPVSMNASTPSLGAAPRHRSVVLLALAAAFILPVAANADTSFLVNDTFTGGLNATTSAYPRWSTGGTPLAYSSPSDNLVITAAGSATENLLSARLFTQTTLGVGDVLTLSYDFTSNNSTNGTIYRCGLYDLGTASVTDGSLLAGATSKAGYYSFYDNNLTAGGNAAVLRRENIASAITTVEGAVTPTVLATTATIANIGTTTRSVVFSITNLGGGATSVTSTLYSAASGGGTALYSLSATDNSGLVTFDSVFLLTPAGTTVTYDNIQVALTTAIPEPGATAACLGGFGLIAALTLRRKRFAGR